MNNRTLLANAIVAILLGASLPSAHADPVERGTGTADQVIEVATGPLAQADDLLRPAQHTADGLSAAASDAADAILRLAGSDDVADDLLELLETRDVQPPDGAFLGEVVDDILTAADERIDETFVEAFTLVGNALVNTNNAIGQTLVNVNNGVGATLVAANQATGDTAVMANNWAGMALTQANQAIGTTSAAGNQAIGDALIAANDAAGDMTILANNQAANTAGAINTAVGHTLAGANHAIGQGATAANTLIWHNNPSGLVGAATSLSADAIHGLRGDAAGLAFDMVKGGVGAATSGDASSPSSSEFGFTMQAAGSASGPPLQPRFSDGPSCATGHYLWQAADRAGNKGSGYAPFQISTSAKSPMVLGKHTNPSDPIPSTAAAQIDGQIVLTQPNAQGQVTLEVVQIDSLAAVRIEVGTQAVEYQYVDRNGRWANQPDRVTLTIDGVKTSNSVLLLGHVIIDTDLDIDMTTSGTSPATLRLIAVPNTGALGFMAVELGTLQSYDRSISQPLPTRIHIATKFDGDATQGGVAVTAQEAAGLPALFKPKGGSAPFVINRIFTDLTVDLDYVVTGGGAGLHLSGDINSPLGAIESLIIPLNGDAFFVHGLQRIDDLDVRVSTGGATLQDCDKQGQLTSGRQVCIKGDSKSPALQIMMDDPPLRITDIPQGQLEIVMGPGSYARIETADDTSNLGASLEVENEFGLDYLFLRHVTYIELQWGDALEDASIDAQFSTIVPSEVTIESDGLQLSAHNVKRITKGVPQLIQSPEIVFEWDADQVVREMSMTGDVEGNTVKMSATGAQKLGLYPGGDGYVLKLTNVKLDRPKGAIKLHAEGEQSGKKTDLWLDVDRTGWRDNYHVRFDAVMEGAGGWRRDNDWPNPGDAASYSAFNPFAWEWVDLMKVQTLND